MAVKRGLGRGIAALIPEEGFITQETPTPIKESQKNQQTAENRKQVEIQISIDRINSNPLQPRKTFIDEELEELAASIREHGIIQPVIVEASGNSFTIIAGERRVRAAKIAGLTEIPVIVRNYSEDKRMAVSIIENVQRSDLNPIEEAAAYKQLMELTGLSQDETAAKVGKNRSTIANALRLLKLPSEIQESIRKGEITAGHARAILSTANTKAQDILYREILKKELSVREAEKFAAVLNSRKKEKINKPSAKGRVPELNAMEEKFLDRLGTKVKINGDLNRGTIMIDYYSMDDLERLYEILG